MQYISFLIGQGRFAGLEGLPGRSSKKCGSGSVWGMSEQGSGEGGLVWLYHPAQAVRFSESRFPLNECGNHVPSQTALMTIFGLDLVCNSSTCGTGSQWSGKAQ